MVDIELLQVIAGTIAVVGATSFTIGYMFGKLWGEIKKVLSERTDFYADIYKGSDYGHCTCGGCGRVVPMKNNFEAEDHDCDFSLAMNN